ncbi:hypothetical protein Trydic_g48 [Trypoxylus dichotomus]
MKIKNRVVKFLCCCNLTLAARLIGFVGVAISLALASVLLRDKNDNDYNASRRMALILGLDWQHFHPSANATHDADPDGRMISIIVLFYSLLYLVTSVTLILATILEIRWLTIPWLLCECLGCFSKIAALIFHSLYATKQLDRDFLLGSIIYVATMTWWWFVVFAAQMVWKWNCLSHRAPVVTYIRSNSKSLEPPSEEFETTNNNVPKETVLDVPAPYIPNERYASI